MIGGLLLAVCVGLAFARSATHLATVGHPVHLDGFRPEARHARRLLLPSLGIAGAAAALAWSLPLAMGLAFATLTGVAWREAADWEQGLVPALGQYGPTAAALGGWLVAWAVASSQPEAARLDAAWASACGVLGGAYLLAGVSKVQQAGLAWVRPSHLGLVLLERSHRGAAWQRSVRRWMAHQPALCVGGAGLALLIELAGPAFCVPELRMPYAAAAGGMQLGFALILGFWEVEWLLLLPALALLAA